MPATKGEAERKKEIREAKLKAKIAAVRGSADVAELNSEVDRLKQVARQEKLQRLSERLNPTGQPRSALKTRVELSRQLHGVQADIRALRGVAQ